MIGVAKKLFLYSYQIVDSICSPFIKETIVRYNLADLHMHSFCSDGLRTPTQAVEEACTAGLQAISLTDHDTVEGGAHVLRDLNLNFRRIAHLQCRLHGR